MKPALALFVLAIAVLLAPARSEPGRPRAAQGYAQRLVSARLLELPPAETDLASIVRDGHRRGDVTLVDVAVALPAAVIAHLVHDDARVRAAASMLVPILLLASIGGIFFARLRGTNGLALPIGAALSATLALLFSTSLVLALRRADGTLVATLALLLLVERLGAMRERDPLHFLEIGLLGMTLVLAQPVYELVALALVVLHLLRHRPTQLVSACVFALGPLLIGAVGSRVWALRIGMVTAPSGASIHALYGLLFSPGRSLFVYSPVAILGVFGMSKLWARDQKRAETILVACLTALVAIARRSDWHGDPAFGPPLVLPLLPLLVEPAAMLLVGRRGRVLFPLAAVAGVVIQMLGVAVDVEAWPRVVGDVRAASGALGWFIDPAADIEFVPQLSPVVGHALLLPIALGHKPPVKPPFSLVVGSDQAETGKPDQGWLAVSQKLDRRTLGANLALAANARRPAQLQLGLWMVLSVVSFVLLARARRRS